MDVSIIIPTYNRRASLERTLNSLAAQIYSAERFEVLIVDDGSTDDTYSINLDKYPYHSRMIRQDNLGSAVARNRGAAEARGDILVFLDDDMLLEPEYITGLVEAHRREEKIVCMGTCRPYLTDESTLFERMFTDNEMPPNLISQKVDFTKCVTNNLSIERDDFFRVGQMQSVAGDGPAWWGDVDFGYRVWKHGLSFVRVGTAVCYHDDYSLRTLKDATYRSEKSASMAVLLWQRYPDILQYLPMFNDMTPIEWSKDRLSLILRKILRRLSASRFVVWVMERLVSRLEKKVEQTNIRQGITIHSLRRLYRWINGAYISRGFLEGLRQYSVKSSSYEAIG